MPVREELWLTQPSIAAPTQRPDPMPKEILLHVPPSIPPHRIVPLIDRAIIDLGLTVTLRGSLKSFPGSTHWHMKLGRQPGTLEVTWWPRHRRLWIKIQSGRTAPCINEITPKLTRELQARLDRLA